MYIILDSWIWVVALGAVGAGDGAGAGAAAAWFWNMLLPAVADLLSKGQRLSSPIFRFFVFGQRC